MSTSHKLSRLHLEHYLHDEILFAAIVIFNNKLYYLCLGSHLFYLFHESFESEPFVFPYEQLSTITCDASYKSLFMLRLVNNNQNTQKKDIYLEASNRDVIVKELQIHWKNNRLLKTWNALTSTKLSKEANSTNSSANNRRANELQILVEDGLPFTRGAKPTLEFVRKNIKTNDTTIQEIGEQYFFTIDKQFSTLPLEAQDLSFLPRNSNNAKHVVLKEQQDNVTLRVSLLEQQVEPITNRMQIKTMTEKIIYDQFLDSKATGSSIDFTIRQNGTGRVVKIQKIFEEDKSLYEGYQATIEICETKEIYSVICLRRMFIPPDAIDTYQDIIFEMSIPGSVSEEKKTNYLNKFENALQSLETVPQCFLYDVLLIRAKLEALDIDPAFFEWCTQELFIKPELLPLKKISGQISSASKPRQNLFASILCKLCGLKLSKEEESAVTNMVDPFEVEKDLYDNVDSPMTLQNASNKHKFEWRSRIANFLVLHVFDGKTGLDISKVVEFLEKPTQSLGTMSAEQRRQKVIETLNYFLHLRLYEGPYEFTMSLEKKINEIEDTNNSILKSLYSIYENDLNQALNEETYSFTDEEKNERKIEMLNMQWNMMQKCKEVCSFNVSIFLELLQVNYFEKILKLPLAYVIKLLTYSLRIVKDYEVLVNLCSLILKNCTESVEFKKQCFSYTPFLHALSTLLQYDDASLLVLIGKILLNISMTSNTVRKWIVYSEYLRFMLHHLSLKKTQPKVITVFCALFRQCLDAEECRVRIANEGTIEVLVEVLKRLVLGSTHISIFASLSSNNLETMPPPPTLSQSLSEHKEEKICSNERLLMLESVCSCLWLLCADEMNAGIAVQTQLTSVLMKILDYYSYAKGETSISYACLQAIFGIFMVISSYDAFRPHIVASTAIIPYILTTLSIISENNGGNIAAKSRAGSIVTASNMEELKKNASSSVSEFSEVELDTIGVLRSALGCLLMLSPNASAMKLMTEYKDKSIISTLNKIQQVFGKDKTLALIVQRIQQRIENNKALQN